MQLTAFDTFKRKGSKFEKMYNQVMDSVFEIMGPWCDFKKGMEFRETSDEILSATVLNAKDSETRWLRATVMVLAAFFRNAGTIMVCLARLEDEARRNSETIESAQRCRILGPPLGFHLDT